jgi:hypothetical protein
MNEKTQALLSTYQKETPIEVLQDKFDEQVARDEIQDYEYSRKIFKDLIDKSTSSIEPLHDLSIDSESPRAFEVLSNMLKNTSEMTEKLMDLHKKRREFTGKLDKDSSITNNNLFIGDASQLQKLLRNQNEE